MSRTRLPPESFGIPDEPDALPSGAEPVSLRPHLASPVLDEPRWKRNLYLAIGFAVALGFFYFHWLNHSPAHTGIDQNGYLVGARMYYQHGSTRLEPRDPATGAVDPYQFVGGMWVGADLGTDRERFYPKYPIGLPVLYAMMMHLRDGVAWLDHRLGLGVGIGHYVHFAYAINPIAMSLAVLATFLLGRTIAGSFAGIIASLLVATSPVVMQLANNPNSHATTMFFSTGGMYLLVRWWQWGGAWRAVLAGLMLGYALTIRYTEGTLVLPLLAVCLFRIRWRSLRSYLPALLAIAWWLVPVLWLLIFNLREINAWTGYDPTYESEGFGWEYFHDNWENMYRQLTYPGMTLTFAVGMVGMFFMLGAAWRLGLVMLGWIVPCLAAYSFYYWAPENLGIGYLRFFVTIFPALAVCAVWLVMLPRNAPVFAGRSVESSPWRLRLGTTLAAGAMTAAAGFLGLYNCVVNVENDGFVMRQNHERAMKVLQHIPPGSVLFCDSTDFVHHLQFVADYRIYSSRAFDRTYIQGLARRVRDEDNTDPTTLDPARSKALYERLKDKSSTELVAERRRIINEALERGVRVFYIANAAPGSSQYDIREVAWVQDNFWGMGRFAMLGPPGAPRGGGPAAPNAPGARRPAPAFGGGMRARNTRMTREQFLERQAQARPQPWGIFELLPRSSASTAAN